MEELISYIPEEFIDYIETEAPWAVDVFLTVKYLAMIFTFILLTAFVLTLIHSRPRAMLRTITQGADVPKSPPSKIQKIWQDISKRLDSKDTEAHKLAIVEADKLLNEMLEMLGYRGKDFEERMSRIPPNEISNRDEIFKAHQTAEKIIKDPDFQISKNDVEKILGDFEKTLQEINIL